MVELYFFSYHEEFLSDKKILMVRFILLYEYSILSTASKQKFDNRN